MDRRNSHPLRPLLALAGLAALLALTGCTLPGNAVVATPLPTPTPVVVTPTPVPPTATVPPTPTAPPTPTPVRDQTPREIYRRVSPAVVTIANCSTQSCQRNVGFGSGVIFDPRGFIITNNHVVEAQQRLQVIFSEGAKRDAQLVGTDPTTDLAVIKVEGELPATALFGDSAKLEPGQAVVAIGSALGEFTNTVTTGIVSGLHRDLQPQPGVTLEDMIQTDAAINPGNSGGPLLNLQGEVIGINTAAIRQTGARGPTAEGIGFAVPSNLARVVGERIIAEGQIARPGIGATTTTVTPGLVVQKELQVRQGVLVEALTRGGPAETAGVQVDDVIVAIDGKTVSKETPYSFLLLAYRPRDRATFTIARGQDRLDLQLLFAEADR